MMVEEEFPVGSWDQQVEGHRLESPHTGQKVAPGGNSAPHLWQYLEAPDTVF